MIQKEVLEEKMEDYRQAGAAPQSEPERQYYFMARARELVADMEEKLGRKPTCCVVTFGCQMNARDSEKLLGILTEVGFADNGEDEKSDFVIFNTCTVRDNADQRVYGRLGILNGYKKKNPAMSATFVTITPMPGNEDRTVRLYDAGTGRCGKAPKELSICQPDLRNTQYL